MNSPLLNKKQTRCIPCDCSCCQRWRRFIAGIKDFNRSVTAPEDKQVIELEVLLLDESDDEFEIGRR